MDISIKWTPATIPCPVLFFTQFKSSTEVLPNKFHFNDHSTGFRPQTQKVTLFYHAPSTFAVKELLISLFKAVFIKIVYLDFQLNAPR